MSASQTRQHQIILSIDRAGQLQVRANGQFTAPELVFALEAVKQKMLMQSGNPSILPNIDDLKRSLRGGS